MRVLCDDENNESKNVSEIRVKETTSEGHFSHHEIWIKHNMQSDMQSAWRACGGKNPSKKVGSINKLIFYKCVIKPFN